MAGKLSTSPMQHLDMEVVERHLCDTLSEEDTDYCITSESTSRCTSPGISPVKVPPLTLEAPIALQFGELEEMSEDCVGGTYWLRHANGIVAIVKPGDMEPGMRHNNKGLNNRSTPTGKLGFTPGTGFIREVLAYELDSGFAGVPETILLQISGHELGRSNNKKVDASAQRFIPNIGQSWDCGPVRYSSESVRKIGIQDLRMLNCDRHGGNMLVTRSENCEETMKVLVPIDHSYCFPNSLEDLDFEWQFWSQAKTPFSLEELHYIEDIDIDREVAICREHGLEEGAIELFTAANICLKEGAKIGMSLFEIASFFRRENVNDPSGLELLISECRTCLDYLSGSIDFTHLQQLASQIMSGDWKASLN